MKHITLIISSMLFLALGACSTKIIPNTMVKDTKENRQVVEFMIRYKKAIESRSIEAVLDLVDDEYFEDMSTVTLDDDYGKQDLPAKLEKSFASIDELKLDLHIQHIEQRENSPLIRVIYRYLQRAHVELPAGNKWVSHNDVNEILLRPLDKDWNDFRIMGGL
jgi:hypothetical protein